MARWLAPLALLAAGLGGDWRSYHLGPDWLGIDSEILSVVFGRSGRVRAVSRAQT